MGNNTVVNKEAHFTQVISMTSDFFVGGESVRDRVIIFAPAALKGSGNLHKMQFLGNF